MTASEALKQTRKKLHAAEIGTADLDALLLVETATGHDRAWLLAHPEYELDPAEIAKLNELANRRVNRTPLAHLTKQKEFYGLTFQVNETVLSPRPESEKIVELAIKYAPRDGRLLDIGTGSGALAIAIHKSRPDLKITATDISTQALTIALANKKRHNSKIKLIQSDLLKDMVGYFDVIVANLPYVPSEDALNPEAHYEPKVALIGGTKGLAVYAQFFPQVPSHLNADGYLIIESDPWQQPELERMAQSQGLKIVEQDYFVSCFKKL